MVTTKRERVQLLIAELRNGGYEQTDGRLRIGNKFCCLGVGCDVANKVAGLGRWEMNSGNNPEDVFVFYIPDPTGTHHRVIMPNPVFEWFGLDCGDPGFDHKLRNGRLTWLSLSSLNDQGFTFSQIADCVEYFLLPEVADA